jgi:signal transduction histidine kinase
MLDRMRRIERYVDWTDEDARLVAAAAPLVRPALPALVADFYAAIRRDPEASAILAGGPEQVARLEQSLRRWLDDLLDGPYDADYLTRRHRVGLRHVEIGVDPLLTAAAMARLRAGLVQALHLAWPPGRDGLGPTARALHKRLDLDLALITHAYHAELLDRVQRHERLAALGQIAGGVAHELRNPLNVAKTSIYYLRNARAATPAKVDEHLRRIERHIDLADGVITTLSRFARAPEPTPQPARLDALLDEILELNPPPEPVRVRRDAPPEPPWVVCDPDQIAIALANLVRNAYDAMPSGGTLDLIIRPEGPAWAVDVRDEGPGIPTEDLARILEPLYSTKPRGLGLGLAIARSLLEKNRASLRIDSRPGHGSTFTVLLDAAEPPR